MGILMYYTQSSTWNTFGIRFVYRGALTVVAVNSCKVASAISIHIEIQICQKLMMYTAVWLMILPYLMQMTEK